MCVANEMAPFSPPRAPNTGSYSWTVPAEAYNSEWTYIRVRVADDGDVVDSGHFSVTDDSYLFVTAPVQEDSFAPGDVIQLRWQQNTIPPGTELTITLRQALHFQADPVLATWSFYNSGAANLQLSPDVEPGINPFYLQLDWDCVLVVCSYVTSEEFMIPTVSEGGWNYDSNTGNAVESIPLFAIDCDSTCPSTGNIVEQQFCSLCDDGHLLTVEASCEDCWATYAYSVANFNLVKGPSGVERFEFTGAGSVDVNLDLLAEFSYETTFDGNKLVVDNLPIFGYPFAIAGCDFSIGAFFDVDLRYELSLLAAGRVRAGADASVQYDAKVVYDANSDDGAVWDSSSDTSFNWHEPVLELDADVTLDLAVAPVIRFNVAGLVNLELSPEVYVAWRNQFQYPAYDALPAGQYYNPAVGTSWFHYGECDSRHFLKYDVQAGLRRVDVNATVGFPSCIADDWTTSWAADPFYLTLGPYPLLSGCLAQYEDTLDYATAQLPLVGAMCDNRLDPRLTQGTYGYGLASDIADLLGIQQHRVHIEPLDQNSETASVVLLDRAASQPMEAPLSEVVPALQDLLDEADTPTGVGGTGQMDLGLFSSCVSRDQVRPGDHDLI